MVLLWVFFLEEAIVFTRGRALWVMVIWAKDRNTHSFFFGIMEPSQNWNKFRWFHDTKKKLCVYNSPQIIQSNPHIFI